MEGRGRTEGAGMLLIFRLSEKPRAVNGVEWIFLAFLEDLEYF